MKNLKKIAALVLGITIFTGTFQVSAKSSEIIFKLVSKSGNASESGDASISGNASISGDASISGNASESGNSSISGNAGNSEKFNDVISLNNYDYSNEVSGSKSIYTCIHNYLSEAKNEVLKEYKNYYKSGFKEYKSSKYILSTYN